MARRDVLIHSTGESPRWGGPTWPDATNTGHTNAPGYPGSLQAQSGPFLTSNSTYNFKDIGQTTVGQDGGAFPDEVHFYGCRFTVSAVEEALLRGYGTNFTFEYCTMKPNVAAPPVAYADSYQYALILDGGYGTSVGALTIDHCNVWGFHDAFPIAGFSGNPKRAFTNNYMHDSAATGGTAHVDFIGHLTDNGSISNVDIIGNNLVGFANSSILGFQYGDYSNFTITDNLFGGGGYTINIQGGGTNNVFRRNTLTTIMKPVFGPLQGGMAWDSGDGNVWRENRWKVPAGAEWGNPAHDGWYWIPDTSDASGLGWSDNSFTSQTDYSG